MTELVVRAGRHDRHAALVHADLDDDAAPELRRRGTGPVGGQRETTVVGVEDADSGAVQAAQLDARGRLWFVVGDRVPAGSARRFVVRGVFERDDAGEWPARWPVDLTQKLDRVVVHVAGESFASYTVAGTRRPYFWPLLGPAGTSVVRGQGSDEHPHHTGLAVNYGGHSEGGSANIWSDWDEAPYGPGGRMLHRGFRRVVGGPVFGEIVHDLTYVDPYGVPVLDEVRAVRVWWTSATERFLELDITVLSVRDQGPRPLLVMARLPGSFDVPTTGRITNAAGVDVSGPGFLSPQYPAAWVDGSGPTGEPPFSPPRGPPEELPDIPGVTRPALGPGAGPWNGIAVIDHPDNHGFPNTVGKYAVLPQITQAHYPPPNAPDGPYRFRVRVFVHDGDAEAADVAGQAVDFAEPCEVEVAP